MILELLLTLLKGFITIVLNLFDLLPVFPENLLSGLNGYLTLIFDNLYCLSFFVPVNTMLICLVTVLAIENFNKVYRIVMFCLRKIPFLQIG